MARMRTALLGLIAMFGTVSWASAANIAYFFDPVYTDEANEAVNLQTAMTGLGHTVVPFSGITGTAWATALATADVVVLPENEGLSLADSLSVDARKALMGFLLSGNGMVGVVDFNRRLPTTLFGSLFGFAAGGSGQDAASDLNVAAAAGTPFAGGPATLPGTNATFHLDTATLPPGALALYTTGASTTVWATTVGGTGRVVCTGYDWFNATNPPEWVDVFGRAISFADAASARSFQIAYFRDGAFVDLVPSGTGEAEALNLEETLVSMGHTLVPFVGTAAANWQAALTDADMIVISEQEAGFLAPALPADTRSVIADFVLNGGGLLVTDSVTQNRTLFNDLFGLTTAPGGYGFNATLNPADATGTAFEVGPTTLPTPSATQFFLASSLPARALSYYENAGNTVAATIDQGFGTLGYLGWDWFFGSNPSFPWFSALSSAVIECAPGTGLPPIAAVAPGADADVHVDLTEFGGLTNAILNFRKGGDAAFQSATLVEGPAGEWHATVPAAFITGAGIQAFLELKDAASTVSTPSGSPTSGRFVNIPVTLANHQFASLPAGAYGLRGVPVQASNPNPVNVFDELGAYNIKNWRYGTFNGSVYVEPNAAAPATPGQGFWIISKNAANIATPGTSTNLSGPIDLTLRQGFNQIANPFAFPVDFADVSRPAEVEANLIGFNGSYVNGVATLLPGDGYWIKNNGPGPRTISIPPLGAGVAAAPRPVLAFSEGAEWALRVDARAGGFRDEGNLLGARSGASEGRDAFDLSEPPPAPEGWVRVAFASSTDGELFCDWRPAGNDGATWTVSFASDQGGQDFSLDLTAERALPEGWSVVAFEGSREIELDEAMRIAGRVGSTTAPRTFTVSVGSTAFLGRVRTETEAAVTAFALAAPFPNPSSTGVTIDLALPQAVGDARVEVFDIQGRRVRTLFEGAAERGIQRVAWDGRTSAGERATAGVYFMRARAGDFSASRKVVLVP